MNNKGGDFEIFIFYIGNSIDKTQSKFVCITTQLLFQVNSKKKKGMVL